MRVLVDSSVWSLAMRRSGTTTGPYEAALQELIQEGRVVMIGPVRQEVLSGIRTKSHFQRLRKKLAAWPDLPILTEDYERAAEHFNSCRAEGIQGAHTDFLICAVAERYKLAILTSDQDFRRYMQIIPIKLFLRP